MPNEFKPRHGSFTLNRKEKDQYENDYDGGIWQEDKERQLLVLHWMNAKDMNGSNGPFISGTVGKPKLRNGQIVTSPITAAAAPQKPPQAPKEDDPFDDDMPF